MAAPVASSRRSPVALGLALLLTAGCAGRYLGSLNDARTYINRGYGVVVPLGPLTARWWIFDPDAPEAGPPGLAPEKKADRIDIDADGMLRLDELTERWEPPLRLLSRTSTRAQIELEVEILSEPAASEVTLRGLFDSEVRSRAQTPTAARLAIESAERRELAYGREALVTSIVGVEGGGAERLALIDQTDFAAEDDIVRRQLVRLRLFAPTLREDWVRDHELILENLLAAPMADAQTPRETW
jgi:hypothetical protein